MFTRGVASPKFPGQKNLVALQFVDICVESVIPSHKNKFTRQLSDCFVFVKPFFSLFSVLNMIILMMKICLEVCVLQFQIFGAVKQ